MENITIKIQETVAKNTENVKASAKQIIRNTKQMQIHTEKSSEEKINKIKQESERKIKNVRTNALNILKQSNNRTKKQEQRAIAAEEKIKELEKELAKLKA